MVAFNAVLTSAAVVLSSVAQVHAWPPHLYTVTAYKPGHKYNGLKVNWAGAFNLFQPQVASYCPDTVESQGLCPNGTDTVLGSSMYPISEVPGGQDLFVNQNGFVSITVQHSHSIPPGSYWEYQGWNWTPLANGTACPTCPKNDLQYNCDVPTGIVSFHLPNATVGGVKACANPYSNQTISLYAVTPGFNRTDCVTLDGLGTHDYAGINPPVWSY